MPKDKSQVEHAEGEGVAEAARPPVEADIDLAYRYMKRQLRERPVAVVATVFGVGLLLGALFAGRRS